MKSIDYRPDVDGMRAVAILSVLLFHAFPNHIPGGFVGVDVFFVISGYLISSIILNDIAANRFSFRTFYARRACRIFPALALVLAASLALGWMILLPDEFQNLGKHVRGGALYISNFILRKEAGYFDVAAEAKPLLHLWSLAIEEQFYIFWPLALVLAARRRWNLLTIIVLLVLASFLYNVIRLPRNPSATFYLPGTRVWELLIGAMLAYVLKHGWTGWSAGVAVRIPTIPADMRAVLGLAAILAPIALLNKSILYPGWWAAAPTIGAALLISARGAWINRVILAHPVAVGIGLISYPLYLWHWPLLSFAHIAYRGEAPWLLVTGLVLLSVLLATLTYHLVERPIRFGPYSRLRAAIVLTGICLAIGGIGQAVYARMAAPYSARFGVDRILIAAGEWEHPANLEALTWKNRPLYRAAAGGEGTVLFVGDSNIEQYSPRIVALTSADPKAHKTALFLTGGGCPPIPAVSRSGYIHCVGLLDDAAAVAEAYRADTIVIGAAWWSYFTNDKHYEVDGIALNVPEAQERAYASLAETIRRFVAQGRRVVVVMNIPFGSDLDPKFLVERDGLNFTIRSGGIELARLRAQYGAITDRLTALATAEGAVVVDPLPHLCTGDGRCPAVDAQGDPIYKDSGHLRPTYTRQHVRYLDEFVRAGAFR